MKKKIKLPVNEAIASGDWFQYDYDMITKVCMKIRFTSFREVQIEEIDRIDEIDKDIPIGIGRLLLLSAEIINMSKQQENKPSLTILDEDDFEYNDFYTFYLDHSNFGDKNNLRVNLLPKFKYNVGFVFLVPNEDTRYYLQATYGKLKRI